MSDYKYIVRFREPYSHRVHYFVAFSSSDPFYAKETGRMVFRPLVGKEPLRMDIRSAKMVRDLMGHGEVVPINEETGDIIG